MTSKISITRALATIKALDLQIKDYFGQERVLAAVVTGESKAPYEKTFTLAELEKRIQADHDGIETLVRNRNAIKSAIIRSNAVTTITLGTKSLTVAEAIVLKSSVPLKETILKNYKAHLTHVRTQLIGLEAKFNDRVDAVFAATMSDSADGPSRTEQHAATREQQQKLTGPAFFDPKKLVQKIEDLTKEISDIKLELDYVLSESNTQTMIDVDM